MNDRLDEILRLYEAGNSYASIGKKLGISRSRVFQLVRNYLRRMDEPKQMKPVDEPFQMRTIRR